METPEANQSPLENHNDTLVAELESLGVDIEKELDGMDAYVATFDFESVVTTIRFILNDRQTGADVVITHMTTLPDNEQGKGWGSKAVKTILRWAKANKLSNIQADQVQIESESFWTANGFVKSPEPNPTNVFVYQN